jgi:hypothetical protein
LGCAKHPKKVCDIIGNFKMPFWLTAVLISVWSV